MSKRRRASELVTGKKNALKYPVNVVALTSGTGTHTKGGVFSIVATATTADSVYLTLDSGTNVGTLVGSTTVYT